jgi:hypothetical protein
MPQCVEDWRIAVHVKSRCFDCGLEVIDEFPVRLFFLASPRVRPVPDDARLQWRVFVLGRLAAEMPEQAEFSKVSDIPGVSILHAIVTNIL